MLGADGVGVAFDAETGEEVDAFDMHSLLHDHLGREHGIEASGDERDSFDRFHHNRGLLYPLIAGQGFQMSRIRSRQPSSRRFNASPR